MDCRCIFIQFSTTTIPHKLSILEKPAAPDYVTSVDPLLQFLASGDSTASCVEYAAGTSAVNVTDSVQNVTANPQNVTAAKVVDDVTNVLEKVKSVGLDNIVFESNDSSHNVTAENAHTISTGSAENVITLSLEDAIFESSDNVANDRVVDVPDGVENIVTLSIHDVIAASGEDSATNQVYNVGNKIYNIDAGLTGTATIRATKVQANTVDYLTPDNAPITNTNKVDFGQTIVLEDVQEGIQRIVRAAVPVEDALVLEELTEDDTRKATEPGIGFCGLLDNKQTDRLINSEDAHNALVQVSKSKSYKQDSKYGQSAHAHDTKSAKEQTKSKNVQDSKAISCDSKYVMDSPCYKSVNEDEYVFSKSMSVGTDSEELSRVTCENKLATDIQPVPNRSHGSQNTGKFIVLSSSSNIKEPNVTVKKHVDKDQQSLGLAVDNNVVRTGFKNTCEIREKVTLVSSKSPSRCIETVPRTSQKIGRPDSKGMDSDKNIQKSVTDGSKRSSSKDVLVIQTRKEHDEIKEDQVYVNRTHRNIDFEPEKDKCDEPLHVSSIKSEVLDEEFEPILMDRVDSSQYSPKEETRSGRKRKTNSKYDDFVAGYKPSSLKKIKVELDNKPKPSVRKSRIKLQTKHLKTRSRKMLSKSQEYQLISKVKYNETDVYVCHLCGFQLPYLEKVHSHLQRSHSERKQIILSEGFKDNVLDEQFMSPAAKCLLKKTPLVKSEAETNAEIRQAEEGFKQNDLTEKDVVGNITVDEVRHDNDGDMKNVNGDGEQGTDDSITNETDQVKSGEESDGRNIEIQSEKATGDSIINGTDKSDNYKDGEDRNVEDNEDENHINDNIATGVDVASTALSEEVLLAFILHHFKERKDDCYECTICRESMKRDGHTLEEWLQHLVKHNLFPHKTTCLMCMEFFPVNYLFKHHMHTVHGQYGNMYVSYLKENLYACHSCEKVAKFKTLAAYEKHMLKEHSVCPVYPCTKSDSCKFIASSEDDLKEHECVVNDKAIGREEICELCGFSSQVRNGVHNHQIRDCPATITAHIDDKQNPFTCDFCNRFFPNEELLQSHQRILHGGPFKCPYENCGKLYKEMDTLRCHVNKIHLHRWRYCCPVCSLQLSDRSALQLHVKAVHENIRDIQCPWQGCGKTFKRKNAMNVHYKRHIGEKSLLCEYCSYGAYQRAAMDHHMRKHHSDMPYTKGRKGKHLNVTLV